MTLIGGTTEEAPQAYKDINSVMESQNELVKIEGTIIPRIVKMSEEQYGKKLFSNNIRSRSGRVLPSGSTRNAKDC